MNSILKQGFVSPWIHFEFESGDALGNYIDTIPPRYFVSFNQVRTVKEACSFTLTVMYAPGNFGEGTASLMHQLLLSNANTRVKYEYGYKIPGGGHIPQGQTYVGIFTKYTETINEGYLTYTITGISRAVDISTPEVSVSDYFADLIRTRGADGTRKPSTVICSLLRGGGDPKIKEFFNGFDWSDIDCSDEEITNSSFQHFVNQQNISIHDLIMGQSKADGTQIVTGIANLGYKNYTPNQAISAGLISSSNVNMRMLNQYFLKTRYGISSQITAQEQSAYNTYENVAKMKYIAFFDNLANMEGKYGSFHYVPQSGRDTNNIFVYNYGNNFIDSDVISFSCDVDWTAALASYPAVANTRVCIDAKGNNVGSNYVTDVIPGFNKTVFNTPSGFDTSAFITETTLARALNFPFSATMTVVGQTDCNQLMDKITVNVFVNGLEHLGLSGQYVIMGIEDDLSDSGFTTKFELTKLVSKQTPSLPGVYKAGSSETEIAMQNDYART